MGKGKMCAQVRLAMSGFPVRPRLAYPAVRRLSFAAPEHSAGSFPQFATEMEGVVCATLYTVFAYGACLHIA